MAKTYISVELNGFASHGECIEFVKQLSDNRLVKKAKTFLDLKVKDRGVLRKVFVK